MKQLEFTDSFVAVMYGFEVDIKRKDGVNEEKSKEENSEMELTKFADSLGNPEGIYYVIPEGGSHYKDFSPNIYIGVVLILQKDIFSEAKSFSKPTEVQRGQIRKLQEDFPEKLKDHEPTLIVYVYC